MNQTNIHEDTIPVGTLDRGSQEIGWDFAFVPKRPFCGGAHEHGWSNGLRAVHCTGEPARVYFLD